MKATPCKSLSSLCIVRERKVAAFAKFDIVWCFVSIMNRTQVLMQAGKGRIAHVLSYELIDFRKKVDKKATIAAGLCTVARFKSDGDCRST